MFTVHTVESAVRPGGTVLLHDTDRQSAPGSWRRTLPASDTLLAAWAARGRPFDAVAHGCHVGVRE